MENLLAFLDIEDLALLLQQAVEIRIRVGKSFGNSGLEILVEEIIGIDHGSSASKTDRTFAGSMQIVEHTPFGSVQARFDADLGQLTGDRLSDFAVFGVTTRRGKKVNFKSAGKTGCSQQLPRLLRIVRKRPERWVFTETMRAQDTVEAIGFTVQDLFNDSILIEGVVDRLAHQFVVEGFMRWVEQ